MQLTQLPDPPHRLDQVSDVLTGSDGERDCREGEDGVRDHAAMLPAILPGVSGRLSKSEKLTS